jgi:hypothetical protein
MANIKVVLKGLMLTQVQTRNVFYFDTTTEQPQYWESDITDYLLALWAEVTMYISPLWAGYAYEVYEWVTPSWEPRFVENITLAGTDTTGELLPTQMAAVALALTTHLKTRGRKAIAGFCTDALVDGVLVSGAISALIGFAAAYVTRVTGSTGDLVPGTWSRKTNTFHPFISGIADTIMGTMRRRKIGVGI